MGQKQAITKQSDVEGITFRATEFMEGLSDTIDKNRSNIGTNQSKLIKTTADIHPGERVESRLNTFYRLLGLPATRDVSKLGADNVEANQKFLDQQGTLNYFNPEDLTAVLASGQSSDNNIGDFVSKRESDYAKSKTPLGFITMMGNPLSIEQLKSDTKVTQQLDSGDQLDRKPPIFPLVVDAATPVYDVIKRASPLFNDGDFIISGTSNARLARTFLESIIYMRTQRFTEDMQEKIGSIAQNTQLFVQGITPVEEPTPKQQKVLDTLLNSLGVSNGQADFNLMEAQMINRLVQSISSAAKGYRRVVEETKRLNNEVSFRPEPKDTAKEKSGNTTQIVPEAPTGQFLEQRIAALNTQIEETNILLTLLPTNKVLKADNKRRIIEGEQGGADLAPDFFVSEFTDVIAWNLTSLKKQLREANFQKSRRLRELEILKQQIMYFSGEVQGLSIFDVLCIFLAMFTISFENLIGLLNNDAKIRLRNNKFFNVQASETNDNITSTSSSLVQSALDANIPVSTALNALQTKVKENFDLAAAFFNNVRAGQNRKG